MERKIKYTEYEMRAVSWCFCVKLSVFKPNRHEQAETGTNRQKMISFDRNRSNVIRTANSKSFRKITQQSAATRNPMQGLGRIGIFMHGRAVPRKIMREQRSTGKSAKPLRFGPEWAGVDLFGPLWSAMSLSRPHWASLDRSGGLWKFSVWNKPYWKSASVISSGQASPLHQQQQVSSGKRRKRLSGGIRLFAMQIAGGLSQAGRKRESAMPVALSQEVRA